jgi:hypothetical protein
MPQASIVAIGPKRHRFFVPISFLFVSDLQVGNVVNLERLNAGVTVLLSTSSSALFHDPLM